jgi:hypothetical protein
MPARVVAVRVVVAPSLSSRAASLAHDMALAFHLE